MRRFEATESLARKLDSEDPLARFRQRFYIPEGTICMDGNSLRLLCRDSESSIDLTTDKMAMTRLKQAAEKAKIELSTLERSVFFLEEGGGPGRIRTGDPYRGEGVYSLPGIRT